MTEWFKEWFSSEDYLKVYKHRDEKDAEILLNTVLSNIVLSKNAKILDSACGTGRHSIILAEKGYEVFGFDLSKNLLSLARQSSTNLKLKLKFFNADLRNVCLNLKFDAIFNLFTSFGYFESDDENFRFFENAYQMLNDGGYFIFDYLNKNFLVDNIKSESIRNIGNITIIEKRTIRNSRVIKNIIIDSVNGKKEFFESVKLYDSKEIIERFELIGYKLKNNFGDYFGNKFDKEKSERLILIFDK